MVASINGQNEESAALGSTSSPVGSRPKGRGFSKLVPKLTRLQFLRTVYRSIVSSQVAETLIAAYRKSSNSQWQYAWKKFQQFISKKGKPTDITKALVLEFLVHTFRSENLSAKTIQVYKGALSVPLKVAFQIDTSDSEFGLLIRSFFIERPPSKQVLPRWNLDKVLEYISSSTDESDDFLLQRTLFLVALATGNRASEIAAMMRTAIIFEENPIRVCVPVKPKFLYKNQRMDRAPPNISFPALNPDGIIHQLCPVNSLKEYLNRSKNLNKSQALFCSKKGGPLKSSDVALKMCRLIEAACPGSVPKGHDVRKIGTSLAWCRGLKPSEIVDRTFWYSSNVFVCRYLSQVSDRLNCVALGTTQ